MKHVKWRPSWYETSFEHDGDVRTWTYLAAVPGGWLVRIRTLVKTKDAHVACSESVEYVPGVLEHPIHKPKP